MHHVWAVTEPNEDDAVIETIKEKYQKSIRERTGQNAFIVEQLDIREVCL